MPGRVARGARSAAASSRNTASARNTSPTTQVPDEGADSSLRREVCRIFGDSQKSTAGHRKAVIALRKVQETCCYEPVNHKKGRQQDDFEADDFNTEVKRCILRVLAVRKAEPAGDRVVRFLGTFLNSASAKDNEIANAADPDATSAPETPTSTLTGETLHMLHPLLSSKDKTIRFRATQITSHIIHSVDTLDENIFHQVRLALMKRIHDKEAPVRLQAVYGLGRVAAEVNPDEEKDDSDSDDDDDGVGQGVLEKLLNILQNDPAAEVRRNLLLNLPINKEVLPYLLERARDADGSTRRALYARLLPALGDFRYLSLTHREKLLRWGLRDRDENVRKATARLFRERWIEDCAALPAEQAAEEEESEGKEKKPAHQAAAPSLDALLELLERIDVVNAGTEGGIALIAMREFWEGRPDYVDYVSFPDTFWEDLSPELAFVARTFNEYCRTSGKEEGYDGPRMLDAMIEEKLPEVTKFGFLLERETNKLLEAVQASAEDEDEEIEEERVQREFLVEQMLHMALTFDYSDEVGRRKMFQLMRTALAHPALPEECTRLVVEILRLTCGEDAKGEREFSRIVIEAIAEVHDAITDDDDQTENSTTEDSFHSATEHIDDSGSSSGMKPSRKNQKEEKELTPEQAERAEEKAMREIMINMKALHIALCMLQNVACGLEENEHLVTMLNSLVVPAVRSQEAPVRERGFVCLGLCCLLSKNLAEENLNLFLLGFVKGHPGLQTIALQIIADILITHPSLLTPPPTESSDPNTTSNTDHQSPENLLLKQILKAFSRSLKSDDPAVQSTGATALAKSMLSRLITDPDLLKQLVIAYFDPDTTANAHLRQSLTYFLPVYCHSRAENAVRMVSIVCPTIAKLAAMRDAYQDEAEADSDIDPEGGMVKLSVVGTMLLDWTDPRKIVGFAEAVGTSQAVVKGAGETHFLLAEAILDRLVTSQVGKEERKVLFSMLGKLHLPEGGCEGDRLGTVLELVTEASETGVAADATSRNTLAKLKTALLRQMHDVMTRERGGGGAEETTVMESTTELPVRGSVAVEQSEQGTGMDVHHARDAEDPVGKTEIEDEDGEEVTELRKTMRDTTIGAPDAEGTRVQFGGETSVMDDEDEVL